MRRNEHKHIFCGCPWRIIIFRHQLSFKSQTKPVIVYLSLANWRSLLHNTDRRPRSTRPEYRPNRIFSFLLSFPDRMHRHSTRGAGTEFVCATRIQRETDEEINDHNIFTISFRDCCYGKKRRRHAAKGLTRGRNRYICSFSFAHIGRATLHGVTRLAGTEFAAAVSQDAPWNSYAPPTRTGTAARSKINRRNINCYIIYALRGPKASIFFLHLCTYIYILHTYTAREPIDVFYFRRTDWSDYDYAKNSENWC